MSDQNTKTYPLYAIMGDQLTDKERIAELADAFNKVCAENADFVAESIKAENRIAELRKEKSWAIQRLVEKTIEQRLERTDWAAQLKHAEGHAAELEAELKAWREYADRIQQLSLVKWKAAREGK